VVRAPAEQKKKIGRSIQTFSLNVNYCGFASSQLYSWKGFIDRFTEFASWDLAAPAFRASFAKASSVFALPDTLNSRHGIR
jgi:hypothetical protein